MTLPLRIVVANEPRIYREVLAGALEAQRCTYDIALLDPEQLDAALTQAPPDVIIATASSPALQHYQGLLLLLYSQEAHQVVLSKGRQVLQMLEQADFSDILSLIDQYTRGIVRDARR